MSIVVAFRPNTSRRAIVRRPDDTGHILFFTGVRYVRDERVEAGASQTAVVIIVAQQATERLLA